MVALKRAAADAYIADPSRGPPTALVFGPDAGLVSERVKAILRASIEDLADPFRMVRVEGDELSVDPGRLLDEVRTIPLFGGRRAIWITAGTRDFVPALEGLGETSHADCRVVIEAGDLRTSSPLRSFCERVAHVAAIACYPDTARELNRLLDEELGAAGLSIAPEARAVLVPLLGGDRRVSLSEIRKLALFARGRDRVEMEDVFEVVSDAAGLALDTLIDAAFAGRPGEVEVLLGRARSAGILPARITGAALNQVGQLHRARITVEAGTSVSAATERMLSKAQFRRVPAVESALRNWNSARLERAMTELAEANLTVRQLTGPAAALADTVASRALLELAQAARQASYRRTG
jgi:DNA polymerase III subunit delta